MTPVAGYLEHFVLYDCRCILCCFILCLQSIADDLKPQHERASLPPRRGEHMTGITVGSMGPVGILWEWELWG